jgi:acyl-CoA thioester hydrolase
MHSDAASERYDLPIRIDSSDIDVHGHVNNVVYMRWVQEAATAHWRAAATAEQQTEVSWFVVRHEIDYRHAARMGDTIIARTWVGIANARTFERFTDILKQEDNRLLARARTLWCPIDPRSGKPVRVSNGIRKRFSVPGTVEQGEQL